MHPFLWYLSQLTSVSLVSFTEDLCISNSIYYLYIAILLLIVIIGRVSLLCSSVSLLDSLNTPTAFCTLSGNLSL